MIAYSFFCYTVPALKVFLLQATYLIATFLLKLKFTSASREFLKKINLKSLEIVNY